MDWSSSMLTCLAFKSGETKRQIEVLFNLCKEGIRIFKDQPNELALTGSF